MNGDLRPGDPQPERRDGEWSCLAVTPALNGPCPCGDATCDGLGPFWCTRPFDHAPFDHAAGQGEFICAVWPVEGSYPVEVRDQEGRTFRYDGPSMQAVRL